MNESRKTKLERYRLKRCRTPEQLRAWVRGFLGLRVPNVAVCPNHQSPMDYLWRAYEEPGRDLVVWAPRGGGKTRLAAIATALDLLHKPGCTVRVLGGSLEQSLRMWEHLLPDLRRMAPKETQEHSARRALELDNGSTAAALTQSERAVRGLHVQKIRCDEVEMFEPQIWEAAQLATTSTPLIGGVIEAISTHHRMGGLMGKLIDRAVANGTPVVRWCLLEVLEKCPPQRECASCPLWEDCQGVAKVKCDGFLKIDDAITQKQRVSRETWASEMLCNRPSTRGCVFPGFSEEKHVCDTVAQDGALMSLAVDFGFNSPFVCLWIADDGRTTWVLDEYVQSQRTVAENMKQVESRPWGRASRICCDPAGNGRNDQTARSNVQLLSAMGYKVQRRSSRIVDGLELLRADLDPALGGAKLFVHSRCVRLIAALKQYRYPETGGEIPLKDGEHDHLVDALRYYFVNRRTGTAVSRSY